MVALWEAFYIENKQLDLDTLRVPNRSPTPISKSDDFRGPSDDIWGAQGPPFPADLGFPGSRAGLNKHILLKPFETATTVRTKLSPAYSG